jgi:F-type H+-transporting ATPase subunit b
MPQLNPEFFVSQLFWLIISFVFLFLFLWRISLPRIGSVLEKRTNKINEDIRVAKKYQAEAEEIQTGINNKLKIAKTETLELIKSANINLQEHATKELEKLDVALNTKLEEASSQVEKNKNESLNQINEQIFEITKLTISKISGTKINDDEIKNALKKIQQKAIN